MGKTNAKLTVEGAGAISRTINAMAAAAADAGVKLVVGYEQEYAVFVHERLDLYHAPPTQAKYLEQPAREWAFRLGRLVYDYVRTHKKSGRALRRALEKAGYVLLAESQKLVPVDTGALRASGFVRLDSTT